MKNTLAKPFAGLIEVPLNRSITATALTLTSVQEEALQALHRKLSSLEYQLRANPCLCGQQSEENDVVVLEQDRYGLPARMVVCKQCSLARTDPVLDDASLASFYEFEFSRLHRGATSPTASYLEYVLPAGESLFQFLTAHLPVKELADITEVGCATGANLLPFQAVGKRVIGFDYDDGYMEYGRQRGLSMQYGDYREQLPLESQDLIILSHVLEHLPDPVSELEQLTSRLRPGGYLYVEVPGIFAITERWKHCPAMYHQNDHLYHFHAAYLRTVFEGLGLEVIYCDQWCKAIVRRPMDWELSQRKSIPLTSVKQEYAAVVRELKAAHLYYEVRTRIVGLADRLGLKATLKALRDRAA